MIAGFVGRHGLHESSVFVIRANWLRTLLAKNGLALIMAVRGERQRLAGEATYRQPRLEFASAVTLDQAGELGRQLIRSKEHSGREEEERSSQRHSRVGILAYGSLIDNPGEELSNATAERVATITPFEVEYARSSRARDGGPTLVPVDSAGARVAAVVLVMSEDTDVAAARDMLFRRETNQVGSADQYVAKSKPGVNDVAVRELKNFGSCDVVLYTQIRSNIAPLTANHLADLAIESAKRSAGKDKRDGISYLSAAKSNGIATPLTAEYEAAVLQKTGTSTLVEAWQACQTPAGSERNT